LILTQNSDRKWSLSTTAKLCHTVYNRGCFKKSFPLGNMTLVIPILPMLQNML